MLRSRRAPHGELISSASKHLQIIGDYLKEQALLDRFRNEMERLSLMKIHAKLLALAVAGSTLALSPVAASANSGDYRCAGLADQARTAADSADAAKQKAAKRFVATGLKLCEAGNSRDAAKQFRSALRTAGVAEVAAE